MTAPQPPNPAPFFHVTLLEPEIPNNTGNIGRTCIALGAALHLIHPLGFDTSVKALRRAGMDYWPRLDVTEHQSWNDYLDDAKPPRLWLTSGKRGKPLWDADLRPGDHLVFGKETAGLPDTLLDQHPDNVITIPMTPGERGLNVATAVCAVLTEAVRQSLHRRDIALDENGRLTSSPTSPPPSHPRRTPSSAPR